VSQLGQLGVVSGTAVDTVMIRRLQDGDEGGHVRRAMREFPIPELCEHIVRRYYIPADRRGNTPYKLLPMYRKSVTLMRQQITMMANFVECGLRKRATMESSASTC
jgi:hypothetical protein